MSFLPQVFLFVIFHQRFNQSGLVVRCSKEIYHQVATNDPAKENENTIHN